MTKSRSKILSKQNHTEKPKLCYRCQRRGHIAKYCWFRTQNGNKQAESVNRKIAEDAGQTSKFEFNNNLSPNQQSFAGAFITTVTVENQRTMHANATYREDNIPTEPLRDLWITDNGGSCHISCRRDWFHNLNMFNGRQKVNVVLGDGTVNQGEGNGTIRILRCVKRKWIEGHIENVLFVPTMNRI